MAAAVSRVDFGPLRGLGTVQQAASPLLRHLRAGRAGTGVLRQLQRLGKTLRGEGEGGGGGKRSGAARVSSLPSDVVALGSIPEGAPAAAALPPPTEDAMS